MHFHLNPRDDLPLYAQLARQLRQAIATGQWSPEQPLPSVRALVGLLGVNQQTVLKAFAELEAEGLIERRQGQGTFVIPGASEGEAKRRRLEVLTELSRLAALARDLGIDEADIHRALTADVETRNDV